MANVRSPNYPPSGLEAALKLARTVYAKDHRNKVSRHTIAKHLGHDSLSGPALAKIGLLRHFGLVEGAGNELRIADDAVHAMLAPEGSSQRREALERLAMQPQLYQDIRKDFPGAVSVENLRYWLGLRGYTTEAAAKAAKAYLETMALVEGKAATDDSEGEPFREARAESPTTPSQSGAQVQKQPARGPVALMQTPAAGEMNLTMYGDRLRVSADVDVKGAKELVARLNKRIALLEEEAAETVPPDVQPLVE